MLRHWGMINMSNVFFAIMFFVIGIRDLIDAKPLKESDDYISLDSDIRRKYRRRRAAAFFVISVIFLCLFVSERIYKIEFDFKSLLVYFVIPFSVPLGYIVYLKWKYEVPFIWDRIDHK